MKKQKKKDSISQNNWSNLVNKATQKLTDAIEEGRQNAIAESNLICLTNTTVDFDLIEEDVRQIHQELKNKGSRVLGSHLILDDRRNLMEIQTYTEKAGKTYQRINSAKVQELRNIPNEVLAELNKNKRVELSFTPN